MSSDDLKSVIFLLDKFVEKYCDQIYLDFQNNDFAENYLFLGPNQNNEIGLLQYLVPKLLDLVYNNLVRRQKTVFRFQFFFKNNDSIAYTAINESYVLSHKMYRIKAEAIIGHSILSL